MFWRVGPRIVRGYSTRSSIGTQLLIKLWPASASASSAAPKSDDDDEHAREHERDSGGGATADELAGRLSRGLELDDGEHWVAEVRRLPCACSVTELEAARAPDDAKLPPVPDVRSATLVNPLELARSSWAAWAARVLSRLDNWSHALFWAAASDAGLGDEAPLTAVELPRLGLSFRVARAAADDALDGAPTPRLFCDQHSTWFVTVPRRGGGAERRVGAGGVGGLLDDEDDGCGSGRRIDDVEADNDDYDNDDAYARELRHGVYLENALDGQRQLLLPGWQCRRVLVNGAPLCKEYLIEVCTGATRDVASHKDKDHPSRC